MYEYVVITKIEEPVIHIEHVDGRTFVIDVSAKELRPMAWETLHLFIEIGAYLPFDPEKKELVLFAKEGAFIG